MRSLRQWVGVLGIVGAVAGCATVSTGTSQSIKVGSTPDGAECVFTRDGETLQKMTTPGSITVKRSKRPITAVCTKEGYEEGRAVMNAQTEFGPLVGPGIIGGVVAAAALVDLSTGANNRYQTALMVELTPIGQADQAAAKPEPRTAAASIATKAPAAGSVQPVAAVTRAPARAPGALPATGLWECGLRGGNNNTYKLQFVVTAEHSIAVTNYANATVTILQQEPLTMTANNPRGNRPMNIVWNTDNTMEITGPSSKKPDSTFHDSGACTKV
jgi:hypothetical protein